MVLPGGILSHWTAGGKKLIFWRVWKGKKGVGTLNSSGPQGSD